VSSAGGVIGLTLANRRRLFFENADATLSWLLPSKARRPVSISYSTAPSEKMKRLEKGPLPLDQDVRSSLRAVADALDKAPWHLHRDLKPGNSHADARESEVLTSVSQGCVAFATAATLTAAGEAVTVTAAPSSNISSYAPSKWKKKWTPERHFFAGRGAVRNAHGPARFRRQEPAKCSIAILEKEPAPISSVKPDDAAGTDTRSRSAWQSPPMNVGRVRVIWRAS